MMKRSTLSDYAAVYIRLLDGSHGYLDQMRWAISRFQQHHGRELFIDELTEDLINDYLGATKEQLAPQTRLSRRNMLVRLWRHASTNPALDQRPQPIRRDLIGKVKRRQRPPRGWSIEEVRQLYLEADRLTGRYAGTLSKRLWWKAYITAAWSTGLRGCDLMSLHRADIPRSGRLSIVQKKTGRHLQGVFSDEAIAAIDELCASHDSDLILPLWCRVSTWRKIARRIVRRTGIGLSIGRLRHSAGTAVEELFPGRGPQFLGNTPQVFYKHYYDRTLAANLPLPPPLSVSPGG